MKKEGLASIAVVVMNVRSRQRRPTPSAMRVLIAGFSVLTVGLAAWSLIRFGL